MAKNLALDFTGVETREVLPVGEYAVEVVNIETKEGNKGPYLNWEFTVATGPFKGKKLWNITSLAQQSLWVLRRQLEALGVKTTSGKFNLNTEALTGLKMGVKIEHKDFEGKTKAKIIDVFPLTEMGDELPVDEEDATDVQE
jgi:hypothetical protein